MSLLRARRNAARLRADIAFLNARLRGLLASLCAILDSESDLLRDTQGGDIPRVWILPLILIESSRGNDSHVRGAARRRLIRDAEREVRALELRLARSNDEIERRSLAGQLAEARRRLRRLRNGG